MERVDPTLSKLRRLIARQEADSRVPPERTLALELGVGRRSLRRALDVLEQEGQISRHQGRGTFVSRQRNGENGSGRNGGGLAAVAVAAERVSLGALADAAVTGAFDGILDHTNPLEVIEVRLAIEPVMARLAAFRASQTEINRLQILVEETRSASDTISYQEADSRFHRTIAEIARNTLFLAIYDTLQSSRRDSGWQRLGENANCYKRQAVYADFHRDIAAAIAARQGDRAQELMQQHLSDVQRYIFQHAFPAGSAQQ
ncbi:GntR family transcriptional regulator [Dongia mobilis]|uniref:GntR family transcriptional regulator n=1 Tax=Dongia mobilis TaxID=578943 RepID=A0A4R6WK22_9PROT|nr:FCD domain-containing protein [Dongia mobilis]TDQ80636.1 GntR family transcriptional regulator [Dongia mobilis]